MWESQEHYEVNKVNTVRETGSHKIPWACNQLTFAVTPFSLSLQFEKKKDLSGIEDITFAMRNRQERFSEKMAADIIARIDAILGLSCTCMNINSNNS